MSKLPSDVITKHPGNPMLKAADVPYEASLIFNAGVAKYEGRYVMAFRNDWGFTEETCGQTHEISIGVAFSEDGISWEPAAAPWLAIRDEEIRWIYDPRITVIDGKACLCFAVDTQHGLRGGILTTEDFDAYEILSLSAPDNRNMVLFPEKIRGKYVRLERPFCTYNPSWKPRFDTWFAESPDLVHWGNNHLVLPVEMVPFANCKTGPGAPPVRTDHGWLTTFHAVFEDHTRCFRAWGGQAWSKEYFGGIMLLDLDEPWKVIGLCPEPLLVPDQPYELEGYRGNVVFPGGMILEDSGEVKIYYGAADTVECLATAHVDDLLALCKPLASR